MSDLDVLLSVAYLHKTQSISHPEEIQISLAMAVLVCVLVFVSAVILVVGKSFVYFLVVVFIPM